MDNQHKLIKGYRDLNTDEIDHINAIKSMGEDLREMLHDLKNHPEYDQRWLAIANTHLQEGIMAAVRAVAQPESF